MAQIPAQRHEDAVGHIATRQGFADALTTVRERAGLTVRDLSKAAGVPVATVGDYLAGAHLPPLKPRPVLANILNACGVTDPVILDQWWAALIRVRRTPGRRPAGAPVPYRGLESFRPEDADWFHGREDLTSLLVERVWAHRPDGGVVAVVGPTGCGKSSLLGAGLVPALNGAVVSVVPGARPARTLAEKLSTFDGGTGPVVVVDQFDEVFTDCAENDRDAFIARLSSMVDQDGAVVVLGLRTDFRPPAPRYPLLARDLAPVVVGPMTPAEARRAITAPAARAKVDIEEALVELLLRDLATVSRHGQGLPLLSYALLETWRRSRNRRMTVADYLATGGIQSA